MINSIHRIKDFGIFQNYGKPTNIESFGRLNIIYGWNYSGKTTLSRLFHCLEVKELNGDYPSACFSIDGSAGSMLTEANLVTDSRTVRVFNTDFIATNMSWDGSAFNPVLLLGEESIDTEKKITVANDRLNRCRLGFKNKREAAKAIEEEVAEKKTKAARQIKTTLSIVEAFTAAHINSLLTAIDATGAEHFIVTEEEVPSLLRVALSSDKDKLEIIKKLVMTPAITPLVDKCTKLLGKVPAFSSTIDYLRNNPQVANWVEHGILIHEKSPVCEFCGNTLTKERMEALRAHFSKDLATYRSELKNALATVQQAYLVYDEKGTVFYYQHLRKDVSEANASLKATVQTYNSELDKLKIALERKSTAPFEQVDCPSASEAPEKEVLTALKAVNALIEKNNETTNNYGKEKQAAINSLKNHYVADFSVREKLQALQDRRGTLLRHRDTYQSAGEKIKSTIAALEAKINLAQRGREEMNSHIANLLGNSNVQIEVVNEDKNDRFRLVRGTVTAKNLSEGEKTAIAFSFFLSKLRELKDIKEAIVYIDDPISSLDSNHIFQVNAIIRDSFFEKIGNEWTTKCKQLFVSTHNFEFLTLLKELPLKEGPGKKRFYQLRRTGMSEAELSNLPQSITKYPSEYHYLFSLIRDFHKAPDKGSVDTLLGIPNAVRRFVELYTMARLPINGSVDQRTEALFGAMKAKRVLKVLHYFSHLNNIERLIRNTDLICDIENAVSDLMEMIRNDDPRHLDALESAVS